MNLAYARFELVRLFRNRQNVIFSIIFPVVMFLVIAGPNIHKSVVKQDGVSITFGRFYLAGMITFGMLAAVVSGGARIALERQIGWNRQLRLTPLRSQAYLRTKVVTSYVVAIVSLLILTVVAVAVGTRVPVNDWLIGAALSLVAIVPFAAMGVMLGHLVKGDSMGPVIGGVMSLFALVGGAYFPITGGLLSHIAQYIPSYWLAQANKHGIGGQDWTSKAWIVIAAWAVVLGVGAAWAYRRDTQRTS